MLTAITHRDHRRAIRDVEELYTLLERHGDDVLRAAIERAVERGHLTVSGVQRALPSSARESDGASRRSRAAQPRGRERVSSRGAIGSLLAPDFVTEGRAVILEGKPGRGKTHLAIAIAYRAMQNGFKIADSARLGADSRRVGVVQRAGSAA